VAGAADPDGIAGTAANGACDLIAEDVELVVAIVVVEAEVA